MKSTKLTNSVFQGLMMAAVVAAALPMPELSLAADLANSVSTVGTGIKNIPNIVSGLFYIGGSALIGAGAMKLKAHAENPVQEPLGKGLGRIGAGAALIALPAFGSWLNNSLAIGSTAATAQGLGPIVQ
jgi:hypothetical protein